MKKLKITLTALLMSIAVVGYADTPATTNDAPRRFVLAKLARQEYNCLKLNTRTGEIWLILGDSRLERIRSVKCTGVQTVSESESVDGRFVLYFVSEIGIPWVYVLDSVTGSVWAMDYGRGGDPDCTFDQIS